MTTTAATANGRSPKPLVSILIPAYNAEKWIRFAIESALGQTYSPIEVIVADDGSTDGTVREIESFGARVQLIRGCHAGANAARNLLSENAAGEWLQYLDADDYLLPNKIADQMHFVEQNGWHLDAVYSPTVLRDEITRSEVATTLRAPYDVATQFVRWIPFCTHGLLLRASAVREVGGWKESQPVCQEHELICRMIMANGRFGAWNQTGTVYRMHSSGTVSKSNPLRTMQMRMSILEQFENWLTETNQMTPAVRQEIYAAVLDTARIAWAIDEGAGERLARRATRNGHHWIFGRPALPLSFQVLTRLLGFRTAQRIARLVRTRGKSALPLEPLGEGAYQTSSTS